MSDSPPPPPPPTPPRAPESVEPAMSELIEQSSLLRQLFFERYFRYALIAVMLVFAAAATLLPRMIRSTPKDFLPVVKIRALDKVQAWSLARSAREKAAAGKINESLLAWQSAVANDPGDPRLSRGLLETLVAQPQISKAHLRIAANQALWLIRLTETNRSDLDLAAQVFARYELNEFVISLLQPIEGNLSDRQAAEYLKALFHREFMDNFGAVWRQYPRAVEVDPQLRVYRAAWEAGWGPPGTLRSGAAALDAATGVAATATLAHRLSLAVAASRTDLAAYERSLASLVDTHADRVSDHLGHWRLLLQIGQRDRAGQLARTYANPPDTPADALSMTDLFLQVGLVDYATEFLAKQVGPFDFRPEIWQRLGGLYATQKDWKALRALAINVRVSDRLRPDLNGLAWFYQGLAEQGMNRPDAAGMAFANAADNPPNEPLLSYRLATGLSQAGQPRLATQLLATLEKEFGGLAAYWLQVLSAAYLARDFDVLYSAAHRGYALATNHPVFINNYAAALLIDRTNAPLAVQLTLRRLTLNPDEPSAILNHALALLQNERLDDAETELRRLRPEQLSSYMNTVLQLGWFELHYRRGQPAAARAAFPKIESRFLMPPQVQWLETVHRSLPAG